MADQESQPGPKAQIDVVLFEHDCSRVRANSQRPVGPARALEDEGFGLEIQRTIATNEPKRTEVTAAQFIAAVPDVTLTRRAAERGGDLLVREIACSRRSSYQHDREERKDVADEHGVLPCLVAARSIVSRGYGLFRMNKWRSSAPRETALGPDQSLQLTAASHRVRQAG